MKEGYNGKQCAYLLHQSLREEVLNKLSQVFLGNCIVEECHFAIDKPQYRWGTMSTKVISQAPLIAHVHHPNTHTCQDFKTTNHTHTQLLSDHIQYSPLGH